MCELKTKLLNTDYVIDNIYLDKYCELILNFKNLNKIKFKTNLHHIIPKAFYKIKNLQIDNSKINLVNLYFSDHILAHYYLCLCTIEPLKTKCILALNFLIGKYNFNIENLDEYQNLYESMRIELSKIQTGKKRSLESIEKTRKGLLGRKRSNIEIDNIKKGIQNRSIDQQVKILQNKVERMKGRIKINNGSTALFIWPEQLEKYENLGFKKGSLPNSYSEDRINKIRNSLINYKRSDNFCKKCSDSHKGKVYINKNNICKMIPKNDLELYLSNGWIKGRLKRKEN